MIREKYIDKKHVILVIFMILFVSLFWICRGNENFYTIDIAEEDSAIAAPELTSGTIYNQNITIFFDKVNTVGLNFANYGNRANAGTVTISIYNNGEQIGYKALDAANIADGVYEFVELEKEINSGETIELEIKSDSEIGQGVTIWSHTNALLSKLGSELEVNGEKQETLLDMVIGYKSPKMTKSFVICFLLLSILFVATGVPQYYSSKLAKSNKARKIAFYLLLIFIGTVVVCLRNMQFISNLIIYGEDGWFLKRQLEQGILKTLFLTRNGGPADFPNTGVYLLIWMATKVTMFFNGLDLGSYPFWAGIFANMYIAFTATVAYRAFELLFNKKAGFVGYFIVLFVNIGKASCEVFGRPLNTAFLWTSTVAFILIIQFIRDDGLSLKSILTSLVCFVGAYTFAIAFLEISIYLLFILLKTIKDRQWKKRVLGNFVLIATLALGVMQLPSLLSSEGAGAMLVYNPDAFIEFFFARHILFPIIAPIYNLLNDHIVIVLMLVYAAIVIFACILEAKRNKTICNSYTLFAALSMGTCLSSAVMRRTLTSHMNQYATTDPDRYFFSCNILSMALLFMAMYIILKQIHWLRARAVLGTAVIAILMLNPYLFHFVEENYAPIHLNNYNGDLADSCKRTIDNLDISGIQATIDLYPPTEIPWETDWPLQYVVVTGLNA